MNSENQEEDTNDHATMSESDDTDSLLAVAEPRGLTNFLGFTVQQMSTHINALSSDNPAGSAENGSKLQEEEEESSREGILGQLGEWTDSDNEQDEAKYDSEGSEASTTSTNSITLVVPPAESKDVKRDEMTINSLPDDSSVGLNVKDSKAVEAFPSNKTLEFTYDKYKSPNYGVRVSPGFAAQGVDFLQGSPNSGWRYRPGSEFDPQIITRAPNFRTPGGFKASEHPPKSLNLTEAQFQEELWKMYAFPDEGGEIDTISEVIKLEQIGERGDGDADRLNGNKVEGATCLEKVESEVIRDPDDEPPDVKEGTEGDEKVSTISQLPADQGGEIVKRKSFSAGDNAGSIPDLGFGLRDFDKLEVRENTVARTHAWLTEGGQAENSNSSQKDKPNVSFAQFRDDDNDMEISPIRAAYLEKNGLNADISRCMPRYRPSKSNAKPPPRKVNLLELDLLWRDIRSTKESMEDDIQKSSDRLKALSISATQDQKQFLEEENTVKLFEEVQKAQSHTAPERKEHKKSSKVPPSTSTQATSNSTQLPNNSSSHERSSQSKDPQRAQRSRHKSPEQNKAATDVSLSFELSEEEASDDLPTMSCLDASALPTDLDTLDVSSILSAAHLKTSEFEEILEKLEDVCDETFEEIKTADDEIDSILAKLEISDFGKSGVNEFIQKYQEEKYKREHCEKEIAQLQAALLTMEEESVVRYKAVSKKDAVLYKMTKAWAEMTKQWKAHEAQTKEVLDKMQKRQKALAESLRQSKSRIEDYEKELGGAVELAASFKSKLEALEEAKGEEVGKLATENCVLKEKFSSLENNLESIKVEKDAAVRALSESQKQLDDRIALHGEMQEKLSYLEGETAEGQRDLAKVAEQKRALEAHLQSVTVRKDNLEGQVLQLSDQLQREVDEKERLKRSLQSETERQVREESDRLHSYYNEKLQEALQLQTQKMIGTETQIVEEHQRQLSELEKEMMRKIREVKNRCLHETSKMKNRYEKELKALREDVAQKQMFISTISSQLQSYVQSEGHWSRPPFQSLPGHVFGQRSSLNLAGNVKINSEISVSSSTESTIEETTTKFRVNHHMSSVAGDEGHSSAEDFHPSKLSRYNTSTPNSAVGTPNLKSSIKGWRELPDIKHLLHREENDSNSVCDAANKLKTLFPPSSSFLNDVETCKQNFNGEPSSLLGESFQKYVQTLAKSYSGSSAVQKCSRPEGDADDYHVRQHTDSHIYCNKQHKDNANSIITTNSGRLTDGSKSAGGGEFLKLSNVGDGGGGSNHNKQTKHSQRPPWK